MMLITNVPAQIMADETTDPQKTEEKMGIAYQLEKSSRNKMVSLVLLRPGLRVMHLYLKRTNLGSHILQ